MNELIDSASTPAELLTAQFYEWELRGRGWLVWDRPVDLEPPFRPFEGHFLPRRFFVDDGAQETGMSRFADRFLGFLGAKAEKPPVIEADDEVDEPPPDYLEE